MLKLSRDVNSDPTLPAARKRLYELLQDRGRRDYFIGTLTSPVVQGVFNDLLATAPKPDTPIDWISAAARYRLDAATTPLAALARAIVREHRKPPADERHVEVVRLVLADIFLKAVNNDLGRYQNTALANLGEGFDAAVLRSVSGHYLAGLMRRVVRQDLMELSTEMQISMETASYNIADAWYARFENDYFEGRRRADVLNVIATNYADFAQIRQEFVNAGARQ
ncbi:hypothetical protein [Mesorhizobium sp.]|uniref:hypothetical protein n=1 Tax=Mesorhizobium sp. TaxID=1871066 RepID=UPI000FE90284|nr:hypothetical protein [Mesorhizobium sp.]RWP58613.1 MAG: hypothetical protein EOR08_26585 [Mesorhizobium sp.]